MDAGVSNAFRVPGSVTAPVRTSTAAMVRRDLGYCSQVSSTVTNLFLAVPHSADSRTGHFTGIREAIAGTLRATCMTSASESAGGSRRPASGRVARQGSRNGFPPRLRTLEQPENPYRRRYTTPRLPAAWPTAAVLGAVLRGRRASLCGRRIEGPAMRLALGSVPCQAFGLALGQDTAFDCAASCRTKAVVSGGRSAGCFPRLP